MHLFCDIKDTNKQTKKQNKQNTHTHTHTQNINEKKNQEQKYCKRKTNVFMRSLFSQHISFKEK